jgi:transposase InsO family protein
MDVTVNARYRRKTNKHENCATVMTLTDVLVVPGLNTDLFSCNAAFERDGIRSYFNDERHLVLPDGGKVTFVEGGHRRKSLIKYHQTRADAYLAASTTAAANDMVHNLLAHFSPDRIAMARERMKLSSSRSLQLDAHGIPRTSELKHASQGCVPCGLGGARMPSISHARPRHNAAVGTFGDSVHVDLCGPYPASVHTGFKYVIGFADRATREVHIYFLINKTAEEVRHAIETFVSDNGRVKQFVFDNGGEFTAGTVEQLLNEMMTSRRFSVPYTPQRNGLIERFWYTLNRQTRILLAHSNHEEALWPFAMSHVVAIHNSLPTRALDPPMAPSEARTGKVPSLKRFSKGVWGCDAIVNLPTPAGATKLSPTGVKANYLGVDARRCGEFFFIPALNKVVSLMNAVKYFPTEFTPIRNAPTPAQPPTVQATVMPIRAIGNYQVVPAVPAAANRPDLPTAMAIPINVSPDQAAMADLNSVLEQMPLIGSSIYSSSFVSDWCFAVDAEAIVSRVDDAPKDHRDIHGRPDEEEWKKAEILDFEAKMRNGAFAIMDRSKMPDGFKAHRLKYAYTNKCDPITKDLIERRARLVAAGYTLRAGIEYTDTACGTMRGSSVRALLCCASIDDDDIFCGDVEKAFTQARIDHEIYLEPPPQLNMKGKVLKALMSIEGLPQSGWLFQNESFAKIRSLDGKQTIDPNIWIIPVTIGSETIDIKVGIWVDDFLIIVPRGRRDLAEKFWSDYRTRFKCKDLVAEPKSFINIEISRDRKNKTITLTQTGYIDAMFDKFMHGSDSKLWTKLWNTPIKDDEESLLAFSKLCPGTEEEQRKIIEQGFMSIVGSILYASAMTRPDISFHTAFLAKLMTSPSPAALDAALGIISYLKRTRKLGITYGPDEKLCLYTDSSWGNENPRPMAGYASCYGGAALSWAAKSLKIVPLSSAEAESAVFSLGCKDAMFVKQLLAELRPKATPQIVINAFIDNTAAIDIVKSHGASGRTKHFERWITYVRDLYQRKIVVVSHLKTDEMPADIFTKPLPYLTFTKFRKMLLGM